MIPDRLDYKAMLVDLANIGLCASDVEYLCGFSECYLSHVNRGIIKDMAYHRAAKIYNLHQRECVQRVKEAA